MHSPSQFIRYYISQGAPRKAVLIYNQTRRQGIHQPTLIPLLLKASAALSSHTYGKALHAHSIKSGVVSHVMIGTSLVSMYSKCRDLVASRKVFDEMPDRNVVTWNALIGAYTRNGDIDSACFIFQQMPLCNTTSVTWTEMIHGFARNGNIDSARLLFEQVPFKMKNVLIWTVMVDGYVSNGDMEAAREVFEQMPERNFFVWSSMIAGYCKKGNVDEAKAIFDRIPVRNLVNWNALIAGYTQNGFCREALESFRRMQAEGFEPDEFTVVSMLSASAQLGSLDFGKEIHELVDRKGIKLNQFVLNGLVHMYAKCGDISNARQIFEGMTCRNNACWNSMISGHAVHGQSEEALELFRQMEVESREKPSDVTFLSVLSACAHGGLVDKGLEVFSQMKGKYGIVGGIEHYGCMVDLLGRAGRLKEAYNLIKTMPMKPNDLVWGAFLGACRTHADTDMAERVVEEISVVGSDISTCKDDVRYVVLSNIYASSDRWEKAEKMRVMMVKNGVQKTPGCSSITIGRN